MFAKDINILVVDDSHNIRKIVEESLQRLGYNNVATAEDANEGLQKLKAALHTPKAFGLVLSDLNMPGPSGLEFLKTVRADRAFKDLPFMLVTTESEKGAVISAVAAGVSGYVVKPFNLETLLKKIEGAWTKHHPAAA